MSAELRKQIEEMIQKVERPAVIAVAAFLFQGSVLANQDRGETKPINDKSIELVLQEPEPTPVQQQEIAMAIVLKGNEVLPIFTPAENFGDLADVISDMKNRFKIADTATISVVTWEGVSDNGKVLFRVSDSTDRYILYTKEDLTVKPAKPSTVKEVKDPTLAALDAVAIDPGKPYELNIEGTKFQSNDLKVRILPGKEPYHPGWAIGGRIVKTEVVETTFYSEALQKDLSASVERIHFVYEPKDGVKVNIVFNNLVYPLDNGNKVKSYAVTQNGANGARFMDWDEFQAKIDSRQIVIALPQRNPSGKDTVLDASKCTEFCDVVIAYHDAYANQAKLFKDLVNGKYPKDGEELEFGNSSYFATRSIGN